jgi:hypothetical protein
MEVMPVRRIFQEDKGIEFTKNNSFTFFGKACALYW